MHNEMNSRLWRALLKKEDINDQYRDRFRESLLQFRKRVGALIQFIPADMRHLTVHDLTHLDALWEMADIISGHNFELNPAEAYVFGGAVLLHDAGMTVAAYEGGEEEIRNKEEWKDAFLSRVNGVEKNTDNSTEDLINKYPEIARLATIDVLRGLHAQKAQDLANQFWVVPNKDEQLYLCEDSELRQHYGTTIGQIAHSHHWPIRKVLKELKSPLGSISTCPTEWVIDKVKIALLLRCADAAHIDSRRAPKLLLSLTKPTGVSAIHWNFQSKLAKPTIEGSRLLYTSTSPFSISEADSWQLCLDTIKMIDKELSDSADILNERGVQSFSITGVVGAKSAESLAEHIKVDGWKPLSTEIQVSDVPQLARMLGGAALYTYNFAPLRELLQNSADAIEARVAIEPDFSIADGRIKLRFTKLNDDEIQLEVEDNGIGMSERTLTSALLDFGQSFWKSEDAKNEFPGLQSKFTNPRGKYGIGFFSIFMWSDKVSVFSKRYDAGKDGANVLEFKSGLGARPILRPAGADFSTQFNTKVSFVIKNSLSNSILNVNKPISDPNSTVRKFVKISNSILVDSWADLLRVICGALPIETRFENDGQSEIVNLPNWRSVDNELFINYFEQISGIIMDDEERKFARSVSDVTHNGFLAGRVFTLPRKDTENNSQRLYVYERGIFVGDKEQGSSCGIIEGYTINAARDNYIAIDLRTDLNWLEKQRDYLFRICNNIGESLACQRALLSLNYYNERSPLFILNRNFMSLDGVMSTIGKTGSIEFSLFNKRYHRENDHYSVLEASSLSSITNFDVSENYLFFLIQVPGRFSEADAEDIKNKKNIKTVSALHKIIYELINCFGNDYTIDVNKISDGYTSDKELKFTITKSINKI